MLSRRLMLIVPFSALLPASASADDARSVIAGAEALATRFRGNPQWGGIWNLIGACQAVLLAPRIRGGGLIVAGQSGDGLVLARHGAVWSDPVGVAMSELSVGFQAGAREVGIAVCILSKPALARLVQGGISGGGSGGFSLGSLGVGAQAGGSSGQGIETLAVSVSEGGLYAGSGLGGMKVSASAALNAALHGATQRPEAALDVPGGRVAGAASLREVLAGATRASFGFTPR
ncbi:YSC84-related protein [Elioraea sp.]|uniref:YSC84-related protein n=1 Tax=Elioraea sp. TaxID=2185103 RepID=UPI0025B97638|nr:YSC84-related protein [Elioraea sp.]